MSVQILPEGQGGLASSFGQALGGGISQQLPEEIKRYRIKSGLENLGDKKGLNPFQIYSQLASIPGLDPGLLGVLAPALQQQIARNEALGADQGGFGGGLAQGFGQPQQDSGQGFGQGFNQSQSNQPNLTPQGTQAPEVQPINQLANNLLRSQPFNFPTLSSANVEAQRRIDNLDTQLNKKFESYIQKGKTLQEGEIGGEVLDLLKQRANNELATSGSSEQSIAQKYARQAKEIAKEYGALKGIKDQVGLINRPTEGTITSIRDINKKLTNLGVPQDQIIDNNAVSLNISRGAASFIQDPLSDTKAGKALHRLKENKGFEGIKNSFTSGDPEVRLAKEIAPLITNKDLIGSMAYIVNQKGYDWRKFTSELQKLLPDDKITTSQSRDLANQSLIPKIPSLSQGWLMGWSGESKKARRVE